MKPLTSECTSWWLMYRKFWTFTTNIWLHIFMSTYVHFKMTMHHRWISSDKCDMWTKSNVAKIKVTSTNTSLSMNQIGSLTLETTGRASNVWMHQQMLFSKWRNVLKIHCKHTCSASLTDSVSLQIQLNALRWWDWDNKEFDKGDIVNRLYALVYSWGLPRTKDLHVDVCVS